MVQGEGASYPYLDGAVRYESEQLRQASAVVSDGHCRRRNTAHGFGNRGWQNADVMAVVSDGSDRGRTQGGRVEHRIERTRVGNGADRGCSTRVQYEFSVAVPRERRHRPPPMCSQRHGVAADAARGSRHEKGADWSGEVESLVGRQNVERNRCRRDRVQAVRNRRDGLDREHYEVGVRAERGRGVGAQAYHSRPHCW